MSNPLPLYFTVGSLATVGNEVTAASFKYYLDTDQTQVVGRSQFGVTDENTSPVNSALLIYFGAGLSGDKAYDSIQYQLLSTTPVGGSGTLTLVSALVDGKTTIVANSNIVVVPNGPGTRVCVRFNLQFTPSGASSAIDFLSPDPDSQNNGT